MLIFCTWCVLEVWRAHALLLSAGLSALEYDGLICTTRTMDKQTLSRMKAIICMAIEGRHAQSLLSFILEYSYNKYRNQIGQLEVPYFTYRPPERSYK